MRAGLGCAVDWLEARIRSIPSWENLEKSSGIFVRVSLRFDRVRCYARPHEENSFARRIAGDLDYARRGWALGGTDLSLQCGGGLCQSRRSNFLHHLGIPDHYFVAEGAAQDRDDSTARVLYPTGISDSACGD